MAKLILLTLAVLLIATAVFAQDTCSPWGGVCQVYEDCCRDLECARYAAKCVPITGAKIPGKDQRPVGPGPYPPQ